MASNVRFVDSLKVGAYNTNMVKLYQLLVTLL